MSYPHYPHCYQHYGEKKTVERLDSFPRSGVEERGKKRQNSSENQKAEGDLSTVSTVSTAEPPEFGTEKRRRFSRFLFENSVIY